jgi:inorganic phosphate transporter, PiT family
VVVNLAFVLAIAIALAFAFTNGFHDAANAIATLVATRVARPGRAIVLAAVFNVLGPLVLGAAVATTVQGIVQVAGERQTIIILGAAMTGAVTWNVFTWWRGLPSSSGHALVGGLVGAALVEGGSDAVNWGGLSGLRPVGVFGVLIALAVSPLLGFIAAFVVERSSRRALRRATKRVGRPIRGGQWVTSSWLAFSHGANDAQKAVGIVFAIILARDPATASVPLWVKLSSAAALTLGTALGGWRIVRTIGRRIFRLRPLDGLVSQASSAGVILGASFLGAPVSTTQVVSTSVVGIGAGRRRYRHVGWTTVFEIGLAWLATLPAAAVLAVAFLPLWRWLT